MEIINTEQKQIIRQYMLTNGQTIAVAESVTAGLLQWALSSIPDAAQFFNGGITAYSLVQKCKHLGVNREHALQVNCVSQRVADEMAIGICDLLNSDWGIGITGYATPVPESGDRLFAHYAIAHRGKITKTDKLVAEKAVPTAIQYYYCRSVFHTFISLL